MSGAGWGGWDGRRSLNQPVWPKGRRSGVVGQEATRAPSPFGSPLSLILGYSDKAIPVGTGSHRDGLEKGEC